METPPATGILKEGGLDNIPGRVEVQPTPNLTVQPPFPGKFTTKPKQRYKFANFLLLDDVAGIIDSLLSLSIEDHSGFTHEQAIIIIGALSESMVDRNLAVQQKLWPDISALAQDYTFLTTLKARMDTYPRERMRATLSIDAWEGDKKTFAECIETSAFRILERSNKILGVLASEWKHTPALTKAMADIEQVAKLVMNETRNILENITSGLQLILPPGADFRLQPVRDVRLYDGRPLLFYPGVLGGQWYVTTYNHPVVKHPGNLWNKWFRNFSNPDSGEVSVKIPPVGGAILSSIRDDYNRALLQFLRVSNPRLAMLDVFNN